MPLREISDFFSLTGTDELILLSPGSLEIDPTRLVGLECHPEDRMIRMHFNASIIDLHFHHQKKDGRSLRDEDMYQVKNLLWGASGGDEQRRRPRGDPRPDYMRAPADGSRVYKDADRVVPIKPEDKPDKTRSMAEAVAMESPLSPQMKAQGEEFDALARLTGAYGALPAIVDDDYPEARLRYASALIGFLDALARNGWFARGSRWRPPAGVECGNLEQ